MNANHAIILILVMVMACIVCLSWWCYRDCGRVVQLELVERNYRRDVEAQASAAQTPGQAQTGNGAGRGSGTGPVPVS